MSRFELAHAQRRTFLLSLGAAVLGPGFARRAAAFRPSARWILQHAASAQLERAVKTLRVVQETTFFDVPEAPRGLRAAERTWLRAPDGLRHEVELSQGLRVVLVSDKRRKVQDPAEGRPGVRALPAFALHFLAGGAPQSATSLAERLVRDLQAMGVDLDEVHHGRFDGRIAYVIGARPWETDKSQVWIDKDEHLVLRVVSRASTAPASGGEEVRLQGYGSPEGGGWFPRVVEHWRGGTLLQRSITRDVEVNADTRKGLFDP